MSFSDAFFIFLPFWTAALTIKATLALRSGEPYRFSWWDGGSMLSGKYLSRRALQFRLVSMVLLCAYSAALLAGQLPFHQGQMICVGLLVATIVIDFSSAKREREDVVPQAKVE